MAPRESLGAKLKAKLSCEVRDTCPPCYPGGRTHLDERTDVRITGPQVAEAALLLGPAVGVGVGDPRGDAQAAAGGAGAPGARVGHAVPVPGLKLALSHCEWRPHSP